MDTAYRVSPLHQDDPERLGPYDLAGRLGAGGMGVVYLGRDPEGRYAAVKTVRSALIHNLELRARFRSEVARARQVPSFCTAEVIDADMDHDPPYLAIEYVDGPSLAEVVHDGGPLSAANLHALAVGVATALTGIHGAGVIHRDLKPENVLLPPGNPKVIDFGIARAVGAATDYTSPQQTVGTLAYMAPERLVAGPSVAVTSAADIFSWGCVVAYGATGRSPFRGDSPTATATRITHHEPNLTGLLPPLSDIVEMSLAKMPDDRPSARELLEMLLHAADGASPAAVPVRNPLPPEAAPAWPMPPSPVPADSSPLVPSTAGPKPSRRRSRWSGQQPTPYVSATATVVLLGIAALVLALGGDPPAAPSVQPTSVVASSPADTRGVLIQDALATPGVWRDSQGRAKRAKCTVRKELTAERLTRDPFACNGPQTIIHDGFDLRVTITLESKASCAAVWFYWNPSRGGNTMNVCQTGASVTQESAEGTRIVGSVAAARPIALRSATKIRITVDGGVVRLFRGGGLAGEIRLPDGSTPRGKIRLGISVETEGGQSPYRVTFADVTVESL